MQCGSCSLTPTHQRYAACELKCMAVKYTVKKWDLYIRGLPHFEICTYHKPLVEVFFYRSILNYIDNPWLLWENHSLQFFSQMGQGKMHYIANALYPELQFSQRQSKKKTNLNSKISYIAYPHRGAHDKHHWRRIWRQNIIESSSTAPQPRQRS